jgi:S-methylmethionine-dependent homocysteine/selenocysteine methylase
VVTLMHAKPDLILESLAVIREHWDGPVGVYAETGDWGVPDWVFNGLGPQEYLAEAERWVQAGVRLVGGCCGVGPEHIAALAGRFGPA